VKEQRLLLGGRGYQDDRGNDLRLWNPGPGLFVGSIRGYGITAFAPLIVAGLNLAAAGDEPVEMFFDVTRISGYDSEFRIQQTKRFLELRRQMMAIHAASTNKLVAMGIAVANVPLGGLLQLHPKLATFEVALEDSLRRRNIVGFSVAVLSAP
jgi:hypothetical protein